MPFSHLPTCPQGRAHGHRSVGLCGSHIILYPSSHLWGFFLVRLISASLSPHTPGARGEVFHPEPQDSHSGEHKPGQTLPKILLNYQKPPHASCFRSKRLAAVLQRWASSFLIFFNLSPELQGKTDNSWQSSPLLQIPTMAPWVFLGPAMVLLGFAWYNPPQGGTPACAWSQAHPAQPPCSVLIPGGLGVLPSPRAGAG